MPTPSETSLCSYRVSVKALIFDEERTRFMVIRHSTGWWGVPGGGLKWGESPHDELRRELREELGVEAEWIAEAPSYFLTSQDVAGGWHANIYYEVRLASTDFAQTEEHVEHRFITADEAHTLAPQQGEIATLAALFRS